MNGYHIHRRLTVRLLIVWSILSVCIGFLVYLFGTWRLESYVVSLAEAEMRLFSDRYDSYRRFSDDEHLSLFRTKVADLIQASHFLVIEIYDRNRKIVAAVMKPGGDTIEQLIPGHEDSVWKERNHRISHTVDGETYLQVFVPMTDTAGLVTGYFEGIYHVDPEVLDRLRGTTVLSLIVVVVVIFVTAFVLYPVIISLNRGLVQYSIDLTKSNIGTIEVLGSAIAKRDSDTNSHNYRVTLYALRLGELCGLGKDEFRSLLKGAFLHDVGKIGISDTILLKKGKLTDDEMSVMKTHVGIGVEIVSRYEWLNDAEQVVKHHHEKYDGTGYPDGLGGTDIPLNARIFAVADVFDALTSQRPYKEAFPFGKSLDIILEGKGNHFDPAIIDRFQVVAEDLYRDICIDNEDILRRKLHSFMQRIFPFESPSG